MQVEAVESRRNLARVLREAGTSFDVIAQVLRAQSNTGVSSVEGDMPRAQTGNEARPNIAAIMRRAYASYAHIGEALEVFHTSTLQFPEVRRRVPLPEWLAQLDRHSARALLEAGFSDIDEVRAVIRSGRPIEGFHPQRIEIIRKWLERNPG